MCKRGTSIALIVACIAKNCLGCPGKQGNRRAPCGYNGSPVSTRATVYDDSYSYGLWMLKLLPPCQMRTFLATSLLQVARSRSWWHLWRPRMHPKSGRGAPPQGKPARYGEGEVLIEGNPELPLDMWLTTEQKMAIAWVMAAGSQRKLTYPYTRLVKTTVGKAVYMCAQMKL